MLLFDVILIFFNLHYCSVDLLSITNLLQSINCLLFCRHLKRSTKYRHKRVFWHYFHFITNDGFRLVLFEESRYQVLNQLINILIFMADHRDLANEMMLHNLRCTHIGMKDFETTWALSLSSNYSHRCLHRRSVNLQCRTVKLVGVRTHGNA